MSRARPRSRMCAAPRPRNSAASLRWVCPGVRPWRAARDARDWGDTDTMTVAAGSCVQEQATFQCRAACLNECADACCHPSSSEALLRPTRSVQRRDAGRLGSRTTAHKNRMHGVRANCRQHLAVCDNLAHCTRYQTLNTYLQLCGHAFKTLTCSLVRSSATL